MVTGPPDRFHGLEAFFRAPDLLFHFEEGSMSRKELVFAKECALTTRDWDTFQAILRKCLKPAVSEPVKVKRSLKNSAAPETVSM